MGYRKDAIEIADGIFTAAWNTALPELKRRALRLSNGHHDRADDMLADTAVKALVFIRRSPESITDPRGFLFIVLQHVFLDSIRRERGDRGTFDRRLDMQATIDAATDERPSTQRLAELQDSLRLVGDVVAGMPREQRRLFAFRFVDDLPYPVIADRLGINQPLARKRVELMRKQLRGVCRRRFA